MLYLFWTLLNVALFLLFIYVAYHAVRAVRHRFGLAAAVLLVMGLLSFVRSPDASKRKELPLTPPGQSILQNQRAFSAVLAQNPVFDTHLTIACRLPEGSAPIEPSTASSYLTGFVTGYEWQPNVAIANYDSAAKNLQYELHGTLQWKLLGMSLYAQSIDYKGAIPVQ